MVLHPSPSRWATSSGRSRIALATEQPYLTVSKRSYVHPHCKRLAGDVCDARWSSTSRVDSPRFRNVARYLQLVSFSEVSSSVSRT
jgi:hypothetical protein